MPESIKRTVEFTATVEKVWKALTDAKELSAWFPNAGAEFEATPGYEGWFAWDIEECTGSYAVKVERVEPLSFISWRWAREADTPISEAKTTLVEWTLEPMDNGGTRLHMLETGFERDQDRAENVQGWAHELAELVTYLGGV